MKYIKKVRATFSSPSFPVFKVSDIRLALNAKKISDGYLYLMLHELAKKKEIIRITRGVYTFHGDSAVVGFAFSPFYYGMENSLELRGISNQGTNFIVMTANNVRAGMRQFDGRNYRVQKISKEHLFGYDLIKYGNYWIPVSDLEKTLIDMVFLNEHISEASAAKIKALIDNKRLGSYLKKYNKEFGIKVMALLNGQKPPTRIRTPSLSSRPSA